MAPIGKLSPHPEWRVIVEFVAARTYGDTLSHEELAAAAGLVYPSTRYRAQMTRASRELRRDHAIELASLKGVGYELVKPEHFIDRGRRRLRIAGRQVRLGIETVAAAPQRLLSDAQNARNADFLAKAGRIESMRRATMRDTRALPAPKPPDVPKMLGVGSATA